ncbi:hypothetical protein [Sphingomonas pituitosa]|uniref:hypothetical protein n=1 Tax=Sphingomonas pituitosa TaxID=99597 RepID=UPI00082BCEC4|nr:hypothetical protein [Sphingomonas pituitosa]
MLRVILCLLLGAGMLWSMPARASGDASCGPVTKLVYASYTGCDDTAMIGPRNDSRINLLLLMADVPGAGPLTGPAQTSIFLDLATLRQASEGEESPFFSDGEGSRCRSNPGGTASFEAAVRANGKVPEQERTALIAARRALQPDCALGTAAGAAIASAARGVKSDAGKVFAAYLEGAAAFYDADFDGAAARFAALVSARDPWLRETARYMLGRVAVNRAQVDYYDEYGAPREGKQIAPKLLADAENGLRAYMKAYPKGAYFFSARGLLRRVYWLAQDWSRLEAEYAALIALPDAERGIDAASLAQEIDAKLFATAAADRLRDPMLLAAFDLMHMRGKNYDGAPCCTPISRGALEAQRARFAGKPALFSYLLAVHAYFVASQPDEALRLLPDASHQTDFGYVAFSRQMLRGIVLEGKADRNVRGFWIDLLAGARRTGQRPVVELALAMHEERHDGLARIFAPDSPIRTQEIRDTLLMNLADAKLLRQQAQAAGASPHERRIALFTLLYKEATRGSHRDFAADARLVPANAPAEGGYYDFGAPDQLPLAIFTRGRKLGDYGCPPLPETQSRLAANPGDAKAMLCLGEFTRVNGFDEFYLDGSPPADHLGGTPSRFAFPPYSRLDAYQAVMASPKATPDDKAYALFRAVNCYAPGGSNECGGKGVEPAVRKGWFQRLKRDYPTSRWAQELRYFW